MNPAAIRWVVVLLCALAAAGCAGIGPGASGPGALPAPKPAAKTAPKTTGADAALQKAVTLIAAATPASLAEARSAASEARKAGAADADAAGAVAEALLRGLYPGASGSGPGTGTGAGPRLAGMRITELFLQRIAPSVSVFDPGTTYDDAAAAEMKRNLAEAAALRPESPLAPCLWGLVLQRRSAPHEQVRVQYEEALRRAPTFAPAAAQLLDLIIASGTGAKELPLLRHLASIPSAAADRFEALARADLAGGQPQAAADAAARGLMESPEEETGAPQRVRLAMLRAAALDASGDWYQALAVLEALLKLQPGLPAAALARARILHEKAENDFDALAVLADAEARNPQNAALPELQARILLDEGRTEEAVAVLQHADEIDPGRVSVLTLLVSVSAKTGRWDDAAAWLDRIPEASRGPEQLRLAWQVATGRGDHEGALEEAKRLEAAGSADALALEARSMIAASRPAEALVVIDRGLQAMKPSGPQASEMHYLRSRAGSEDPLRDLRTALRENPDNLEALEAISDALAAQKDYRKAAEYARRASVLAPANAALAEKAADLAKRAAASPAPRTPPSE